MTLYKAVLSHRMNKIIFFLIKKTAFIFNKSECFFIYKFQFLSLHLAKSLDKAYDYIC